MSSLLYGTLSKKRLETLSTAPLVYAQSAEAELQPVGEGTPKATSKQTVSHWQDTLAALVPAEVLAFHAFFMTLGTTTTGTGDDTKTVITSPTEMAIVFFVLVGLAFFLYLVGARSFKIQDFLRAGVAALAFVLWTMIQPTTAFDALDWDPSALIRMTIALAGAALLGVAANALATKADTSGPKEAATTP